MSVALMDYSPTDFPSPLAAAWQCDLATNTLRWSPGVYAMFGLPRGSALRRAAIVEMYGARSRGLLANLRSAAIANLESFTFEARIYRPDGMPRWIRVTADIEHDNGRATCLYGLKQDITAEVDARAQSGAR